MKSSRATSPAHKSDRPTTLGTAYGHNTPSVNYNTIISRGSHGASIAADFHPLDSQDDIKYYTDHIPLKIYKQQEIHVTSELPNSLGDSVPGVDRVLFKV
jgi:hypothetical protein